MSSEQRRKIKFHTEAQRNLCAFVPLCLCVILIISCPNSLFSPDNNIDLQPGMGAVTISFSDDVSRTILPNAPALTELTEFDFDFTATSGGTSDRPTITRRSDNDYTITLDEGTYSLTVYAYKGSDASRQLAASSALITSIVITDGGITSIPGGTVKLSAIFGTGVGTFRWNIGFTGVSITSATMRVLQGGTPVNIGTYGTSVDLLAIPALNVSDPYPELTSGLYTIEFTIERTDGRKIVWYEAMHIYATLNSPCLIIFGDAHFNNPIHTVTFNDGFSTATYLPQSVLHGGQLTSLPSVTRTSDAYLYLTSTIPSTPGWVPGWSPGGWQDTAGNTYTTSTPVHTSVTLTAQWTTDCITAIYARTEPTDFEKAVAHVNANSNAYTLYVANNVNVSPQTLSVVGVNLTLLGMGTGAEIGLSTTEGSIFSISNNSTLTLGNGITLVGTDNNEKPLVWVGQDGTFNMENGSVIKDNEVDPGNDGCGGVYVMIGTFNMNGGLITNNKSDGAGVTVNSGVLNITDGSITGNTAIYGDVFVEKTDNITLSNNAVIGILTLYTSSPQPSIIIQTGWIGSITTAINLAYEGSNNWEDKVILTGSGVNPTIVNGINSKLGNFININNTTTSAPISDTHILEYDAGPPATGVLKALPSGDVLVTKDSGIPKAYNTLAEALAAIDTAGDYLVQVKSHSSPAGVIPILATGNRTITIESATVGTEAIVQLTGNGQLINMSNGRGVTLTLRDGITLKGHDTNNVSLIRLFSSGTPSPVLNIENGAKIIGNTYTSAAGGAAIDISVGTVNMSGGEISGNTAFRGGGVFITDSGAFNMTGGTISGNKAATGGGVYFSNSLGTMTIGGTAKIINNTLMDGTTTNNIYLDTGRTITIASGADAPTTMNVGITAPSYPYTFVAATGSTAGQEDYFFADASGKEIIRKSDGSLIITDPPVWEYTVANDGGSFAVSGGTITAGTLGTAQACIDAICADAGMKNIKIRFGDATTPLLDLGSGTDIQRINFGNASPPFVWGKITLEGSVTSNFSHATGGVITATGVNIESSADITNTNATGTNVRAFYNNNGTLEITGGTVKAYSGEAIFNQNTGAVTISGGTVGVMNALNVEANGIAINNASTGTITISNTATVTSANTTSTSGTIVNAGGTVTISGGTVQNTSTGNAIYNSSTNANAVTITGGTVSAMDVTGGGVAIYNNGTGAINISQALGATTIITSANSYNTAGTIVLAAPAADNTTTRLTISGGTVRNTQDSSSARAIYNNSTGAVNISGGTVGAMNAAGTAGTLGVAIWNNSTGQITISESNTSTPTLITSASNASNQGTIVLAAPATDNTNDRLTISGGTVRNTSTAINARAIYNNSTGAVNISGGTVGAMNAAGTAGTLGVAIWNNSTGAINISNNANITSANATQTAGTIVLAEPATDNTNVRLTISGGTVRNTAIGINARAIYNNSTGAVNISGGEVSVIAGIAVYNYYNGLIAISESNSLTPTIITSANVNATMPGTIFLADTYTTTATRLIVTGGKIQNTADNANAMAIYNQSYGAVDILGGTVDTVSSGIAIQSTYNSASSIILGNNPTITGRIQPVLGKLSVNATFDPSPAGKRFYLDFGATPTVGQTAVAGGGGKTPSLSSFFELYGATNREIIDNGVNLVIAEPSFGGGITIILPTPGGIPTVNNDNLTLSRTNSGGHSNTATITITPPSSDTITSVAWYHTSNTITPFASGTSPTLTLTVGNYLGNPYDQLGTQTITAEITTSAGFYSVDVTVKVVE